MNLKPALPEPPAPTCAPCDKPAHIDAAYGDGPTNAVHELLCDEHWDEVRSKSAYICGALLHALSEAVLSDLEG